MAIDNIKKTHNNNNNNVHFKDHNKVEKSHKSNRKREIIKLVSFIALAIILGGIWFSYHNEISLTKGILRSGVVCTGGSIIGIILGSAYDYITRQKKPKEEEKAIETKNEETDNEFRQNTGGSAQKPAAGTYNGSTNVTKKGEGRE